MTHSADPEAVHGIFEYLEDKFLFLDKLGRLMLIELLCLLESQLIVVIKLVSVY